MRLYGKFTKVEKQADGTLYVEGIASSEAVDSAGEVVKASAMAAALPDYLKFPALREMHQLIAAGKTLAADVMEDGRTYIAAKVVDPIACKKVEEGVYAGFSIGGHVPPGGRNKDNQKIIEVLKLSEISLVDRPANPEAVISLVKIDQPEPVQTSVQVPAAQSAAKQDPPATAATTKAEAPPAAPAATSAASVQKGMYQVGWCAELCGALVSLANDAQYEADYEGDGSKVPGRLKVLATELAEILKDLVAEEADELVAAKVDKADLDKAGTLKKTERLGSVVRAFLAASKGEDFATRATEAEQATGAAGAALRKVVAERDELQRQLRDAQLGLKAKGVPQDPKFLEAVTKAEELEKAVKDAQDATEQAGLALKTVLGERDDLKQQRDALQRTLADASGKAAEELEKVIEERTVLRGQLDEYVVKYAKAEVELKTKGALKVVPVEKGQDVDRPVVNAAAPPPEGTPERALHDIKKIHRSGGKPLAFLGPTPAPGETR